MEYNIDDKFFIISLYRNEATFLDFASFESIFSMTVWNIIDDRYSIFPLYRNEATFCFCPFFKVFSVWQCGILSMIDTPIFFFYMYIETMHNLLIFARFQSIFSMTVWNTIDDRYSIFPLYRNEATSLASAPFSEHFQYDSLEYYR